MEFLGVTHKVMHDTTRIILDGLVEDVVDTNAQTKESETATKTKESETATKLKKANWSYGIQKFG